MKSGKVNKDKVFSFINNKRIETIKEYIVAFHLDEKITNPLGCIRVNEDIKNYFGIINNSTYDIYLKLKNPLSEDTFVRLLLAKLTTENYFCEK